MTDKRDNSVIMQGIRILQSWNCVLEDCKVAKIIDIAMLRCWERAGKWRIESDCQEGVRAQLERMKELCKERNSLYEKQNDLKEQKQKIEKLLER